MFNYIPHTMSSLSPSPFLHCNSTSSSQLNLPSIFMSNFIKLPVFVGPYLVDLSFTMFPLIVFCQLFACILRRPILSPTLHQNGVFSHSSLFQYFNDPSAQTHASPWTSSAYCFFPLFGKFYVQSFSSPNLDIIAYIDEYLP